MTTSTDWPAILSLLASMILLLAATVSVSYRNRPRLAAFLAVLGFVVLLGALAMDR